jgi:hypothetical protein
MKKLSEQLLEMSKKTAALENKAVARNEEMERQFEQDVADARESAQAAQAALTAKLNSIGQTMSAQWQQVQDSFNKQVAAARSKVAERQAAYDLAVAQEHAKFDQDYAQVSTEFAQWAAAEANAAIAQANQSRAYAQYLENTPVASATTS